MLCTSAPPSFDDVTVTVSTEARGAAVAWASWMAGTDCVSADECCWRTISMTPEGLRLGMKPVPRRMRHNASGEDRLPFAPDDRIPRTASFETTSGTPDCAV